MNSPASLTPPVKSAAPAAAAQNKSAAPKAPKEPKAPRESSFKKLYPDTAKITIKTEGGKNPKREGSAAAKRFALYKNGMTVGEAIKAGVFYADLAWDVGHGLVSIA
jgi:Cu/Ag efflux protein CusF